MPLDYDLHTHLKGLEIILDEYTEWFLQVTRLIFYPTQDQNNGNGKGQTHACPESFSLWIQQAEKDGSIKQGVLRGIVNLQRDLSVRSDAMIDDTAKSKTPPAYGDYLKLTVLFEEFIGHLRRLEKDTLLEDSGMDTLTGLRNKDVMEKDIKREMDRLARQGKTFALALVKIDHFDAIQKEATSAESDECIKIVGEMVKKSMRSFDDAYRVNNGMFVLSLKQTGTNGGIRALKRLKAELDKSKATYHVQGKTLPLSLSSCIGEPADGEDILKFLENLQKDLAVNQGGDGSVVEYFDLSPLQRYVRDQEQGRG